MDLHYLSHREIPVADKALVEKTRKALTSINKEFQLGPDYKQVAGAVVKPADGRIPMRIDFRAYKPGVPTCAYLGPNVSLTEKLFAGEQFSPEFREKIEAGFKCYEALIAAGNAQSSKKRRR
jgi:hypothetical protein